MAAIDKSVSDTMTLLEYLYSSERPDKREWITGDEAVNIEFGQAGATFVNGAYSCYGTYRAIYHFANTVYANSNCFANWDGTAAVASYTFPAGSWIYGKFVNPVFSSGTALLLKG